MTLRVPVTISILVPKKQQHCFTRVGTAFSWPKKKIVAKTKFLWPKKKYHGSELVLLLSCFGLSSPGSKARRQNAFSRHFSYATRIC
jgi:hypothetical protein